MDRRDFLKNAGQGTAGVSLSKATLVCAKISPNTGDASTEFENSGNNLNNLLTPIENIEQGSLNFCKKSRFENRITTTSGIPNQRTSSFPNMDYPCAIRVLDKRNSNWRSLLKISHFRIENGNS